VSARSWSQLHVEPEVHHVAVLDDVFLAFLAGLAGFLGAYGEVGLQAEQFVAGADDAIEAGFLEAQRVEKLILLLVRKDSGFAFDLVGNYNGGGADRKLTQYTYDDCAVVEWECCLKDSTQG